MSEKHLAKAELTRRKWLALAGAGSAAGLAGCIGGEGEGETPTATPGGETEGADTPAATSTPGPAEGTPVHFLTDYNNDAWQARWGDELIPGFTGETGIDVRIEYAGFSGQGESRLATLIQAGDPPTIHTSTFTEVADLFASGHLATVNGVVDRIESVAGEMSVTPFSRDGNYWQVPHGYYAAVLLYREDVYEQLGLSVPESFQELLDNAKAIDESDVGGRGYGLAGTKTGKASPEFGLFLANMGAAALRWKDPDARDEVELWLPREEVIRLLEYVEELSQYSPDPTNISWPQSIRNWINGQFTQQFHLNVWPQGVAGAVGVTSIAENTGVAPFPTWTEGGITKDDSRLADPAPDGYHVFETGENTRGGKRFAEWLYGESIERTASMYVTEPTRFLPNYEDVIASDAYRSFDHWQRFPKHLRQLEYVQDTIVGDYYGNVPEADLGSSPVAVYVGRFFIYAQMVNGVVTGSMTPEQAYQFGRERFAQRIEEGRQRFDT